MQKFTQKNMPLKDVCSKSRASPDTLKSRSILAL